MAHVGPLPVEELVPTLMSGAGALLILRLRSLRARRRPTRTGSRGTPEVESHETPRRMQ
jgi:hypothetical protein